MLRLNGILSSTILALIGLAHVAGDAEAKTDSFIAAGCVPSDATIQGNKHFTGGHGVQFKGNATGTIRLICPITDRSSDGPWTHFHMHYKDPDGMGIVYRVRVTLKKALEGSPNSTSICTGDSNTSNVTTYNTIDCNFPDFSAADAWYWFEVTMERSASAELIEILGFELINNV